MNTKHNNIIILGAVLIILGSIYFISKIIFKNTYTNTSNKTSLNINPRTQLAALEGAGSGLVGWWKFDEGNGTVANDSSGSGNNGTLVSGPEWVSGQVGSSALKFSPTNYMTVPTTSGFYGNAISFSAWVKPLSTPASSCYLIEAYRNIMPHTSFNLSLHSSGNYFYSQVFNTDGTVNGLTNSVTSGMNKWYFLATTYDGSNVTLYVNGVQASQQPFSGSVNLNDSFYVNTYKGSAGCDVVTDDVRIYSRALSATEITDLYNQGNTPTPTPINGQCGTTVNTCTNGTFSDTADTSTDYLWNCAGTNGGSTASCSSPIPPTTPTTYTLTVSKTGTGQGTITSSPSSINCGSTCSISNISSGTSYTLTATPQSGSTFTGWSGACSGTGTCTTSITANTTVTATFTTQTPPTGNRVDRLDSSGTVIASFTTIQACADVVQAGESCLVYKGIYNEAVDITRSGSPSSPIIFRSDVGAKVRTIVMTNASHVTINGFDIGDNNTGERGIWLISSNHIDIMNNKIHNTSSKGIGFGTYNSATTDYDNPSNFVAIRNNNISFTGRYLYPDYGVDIYGDNNIVENNDVSHVSDYIHLHGRSNVVRNNIFHDSSSLEWGIAPEIDHLDGVQVWSSLISPFQHNLIEGNLMYNTTDSNVHFILLQNTGGILNGSDAIVRYNRANDTGNYFALVNNGFTGAKLYNNTVYKIHYDPRPWYTISFTVGSAGGAVINNIFYDSQRDYGSVYYVASDSQSGFHSNNNLAYNSDCSTSCLWQNPIKSESDAQLNKDPIFSGPSSNDFSLQSSSPAIDSGGPLTQVSSSDSGAGSTISLNNVNFFQDGWAGVTPDCIAVGSVTNTACISSINYSTNTITLTSSITRHVGDPVYLYSDSTGRRVLYGSAPDIGAYEYTGPTSPTPPLCTSFTYSSWSLCSNSVQTRTIVSSSPTSCTGGTPILTQSCTNTISSDFNSDGLVNTIDLSLLLSYWNQTNPTYDLNNDGVVNSLDYATLVGSWSL